MDTSLPATERAQRLLDASTLEQKMRWLVEQPAAQPDRTSWPDGVTYPAQVPCTPFIAFVDSPHGLRGPSGVTAFAAPIAEASAWNPDLTYAKYQAMAREAYGKRRNVVLAPGLSGARVPMLGRTAEYLGEDPVLAGVLAGAGTRGLQEADPPVMSTPKHYVANEQRFEEDDSSSNVDDRTLRQIYNLSFEIAVREGDPGSIMCSYNPINGVHACENPEILDGLLKDETGFEGFVMSDFGAVHSTVPSLAAGLDMELNRPVFYTPDNLHAALAAGELTEAQIDAAALRVVTTFIRVGLFDHPLPDEVVPDVSTPEHRGIARQIAEQGSVLLKNAGILPLAGEGQTIAVIGPTAANDPTDGISAESVCSAHFSVVDCPDPVAPLDAITERAAADGSTVVFDNGADLGSAAATAAGADLAVVFGYKAGPYQQDFPDLALNGNGDALIEAVAGANPDTVVVLGTGTVVLMPWLDEVEAVLQTWYPGDQQGTAIANLLFGDVNPSGKTALSFPRSMADLPTTTPEQYPGVVDESGMRQVAFSEGMAVGYRWYDSQDIEPLFEFGHGLSYTSFEYSRLRVTPRSTHGSHELVVRFRIANTGDRAGREVAQIYLDLPPVADEPSKRLIGWASAELAPGEKRNVVVRLSADDLANRRLLQYWDEGRQDWTTPGGTYTVRVGSSSRELPLAGDFRVRDHPVRPAAWS